MKGKVIYGRGRKPRYFLNDQEVPQEAFDAAFPAKRLGQPMQGMFPACWPMRSRALAVHRKQVAKANARNKRMGLGTRYDSDGTAIIPDRGERKRLLRQEQFHDNEAGYGD